MRVTKPITISIMPEMLQQVNRIAKEESRTRSELLREAVRRYIAEKELSRLGRYGQGKANELNLKAKDVARLIREYRKEKTNA
ncbi:MAG: ribbon-helix-helix domain-containing protein [Desulfosarcinaceae bacterium]